MGVVLWVLALVVGVGLVAAGTWKATRPREELEQTETLAWVEDFSPGVVRVISLLEIAGGLGLILPAALDVMPGLSVAAAVCVVLLMVGAIVVHVRRGEPRMVVLNVVVLVVMVLVVVGRLGPYPFGS